MTAVKEADESGFSWELIAKQVNSRNAMQCLKKWYKAVWFNGLLVNHTPRHQYMCWKSSGAKLVKWCREDDVRLIGE